MVVCSTISEHAPGPGRSSRMRYALARIVGGGRRLSAMALFLALGLHSAWSHANLLYSAAVTLHGRLQWAEPRKYTRTADGGLSGSPGPGDPEASVEVRVTLKGSISREDVYAARLMESLVRLGRHRIADNTVSVSGEGGDADAAMELGRLLRKMGVSTYVAAGEHCLSACVFAYMGGDRRATAGQLGIHRPYFSSSGKVPDRRSYYRRLQKRLQLFIEELDFPPSLYEAIMAVPPESLQILTTSQLKRFYLQGMSPSAEDEADAVAAGKLGMSMTEYLAHKAQARPCAGFFRGEGACEDGGKPVAHGSAVDHADPPAKADADVAAGRTATSEAEAEGGPGTSRGAAVAPHRSQ